MSIYISSKVTYDSFKSISFNRVSFVDSTLLSLNVFKGTIIRLSVILLNLDNLSSANSESKNRFFLNYPAIMGVCNLTLDSFSDGGKNFKSKDALENIYKLWMYLEYLSQQLHI